MDVFVGYFQDPEDLPGLAHFLEHMLFLGTEKYPDEGQYHKLLSEHGGKSNAYTSGDHTNYHFDVAAPYLEMALDVFAQFFIAPSFTETATDRELNAVDSENSKNLQADEWRTNQLLRSHSNPNHPFHKYGTGNLQTLKEIPNSRGIDTRQKMKEFYERHYSANIMKLVVLGTESLDCLEQIVRDKFQSIPNYDRSVHVYNVSPFPRTHTMQSIFSVPVTDTRTLVVMFPCPSSVKTYKTKPEHCVAHLIGHEGSGSLLSHLKAQLWANTLTAGLVPISADEALFSVSIGLTELGVKEWQEMVVVIFQYIALLKHAVTNNRVALESICEELRVMDTITFRYKDKAQPFNCVIKLACNLSQYIQISISNASKPHTTAHTYNHNVHSHTS
eukprot:c9899_g1_i3.p1 GENE.c9899_g1_i3~~c9899_g1_i3.p1  ORF type:complete len:436 (-),score=106.58 c9899_g1_i3:173-1336(-)